MSLRDKRRILEQIALEFRGKLQDGSIVVPESVVYLGFDGWLGPQDGGWYGNIRAQTGDFRIHEVPIYVAAKDAPFETKAQEKVDDAMAFILKVIETAEKT